MRFHPQIFQGRRRVTTPCPEEFRRGLRSLGWPLPSTHQVEPLAEGSSWPLQKFDSGTSLTAISRHRYLSRGTQALRAHGFKKIRESRLCRCQCQHKKCSTHVSICRSAASISMHYFDAHLTGSHIGADYRFFVVRPT